MQGIPIKMILSSGNRHDIKFTEELIKDIKTDTILADRGYDAKWFRNLIQNPVIPCRRNRKVQIEYDEELYKKRNVVERFFQRIKRFRRIGIRYEKTAQSFYGMLQVGVFIVVSRFMNIYSA